MFDINDLITFNISSDILVATGGMMLSLCNDQVVSQEISQQIVHQLTVQDADIDGIINGESSEDVTFAVPVGIAMLIGSVLLAHVDGEFGDSVRVLMRGWMPALEQIKVGLDRGDSAPFDEFGNCMN